MRRHLHQVVATALVALALVFGASPAAARRQKTGAGAASAVDAPRGRSAKSAPATAVDLNTASEADLIALPGVGKATAKKIIAGRPYSSVADLAKAGVSAKTIDQITPMVTVSGTRAPAAAPAAASAPQAPVQHAAPREGKPNKTTPATAVDLNAASESDLIALPGVGKATAKKIVAARPYSSVADLAKAGLSAKTISQITPLVTVSGTSAPAQPPAAAPAAPPQAPLQPAAPRPAPMGRPNGGAVSAPAQLPPQTGMVWVNLESKVFHHEGSRWYGRTKNGKFMTETDALAAGYREAKTHPSKKQP